MPVYEYECNEHGAFEHVRSMAESSRPAPCPECAALGKRIISAPHLSCMPRSQVKARDHNERSRHEPRVVHANDAPRQGPPAPRKLHSHAASGRPWMLGHG